MFNFPNLEGRFYTNTFCTHSGSSVYNFTSTFFEMSRLALFFFPAFSGELSCGFGIMGLCFRDNQTSSLNDVC